MVRRNGFESKKDEKQLEALKTEMYKVMISTISMVFYVTEAVK